MRLIVLVFTLVAFAYAALVDPPRAQSLQSDLPGTYAVSGTAPDGQSYTATADIAHVGQLFYVRWVMESGTLYGTGWVEKGDLTVGFAVNGAPGLVIFRVKDNRPLTLEGSWASYGMDRRSRETLVKQPSP